MSRTNEELKLIFEEPVQKKKAPKHLADFSPEDRKNFAKELGLQPFRAAQVATHYFSHLNNDPSTWTDIPADQRQSIADALTPQLMELVTTRTTDGGMTRKDLWKLHDGTLVESVLMRYSDRTTVCISSQAGCGMNCPFCATGQGGLKRNLTAAEITDQIVAAARACANGELPGGPTRLSNIVFMGMGEPLANYNAVIRTLHNITDANPDGLGISARSVTVSTVGLVNGVEKLMEEGINCTLAISLHTPDDELRDSLVPINNRFKVREILAAADAYEKKTGRRYSIEYALIRDIKDRHGEPISWDVCSRTVRHMSISFHSTQLQDRSGRPLAAKMRLSLSVFSRAMVFPSLFATLVVVKLMAPVANWPPQNLLSKQNFPWLLVKPKITPS
jgi:23S rRNA (adenine2503-C2)-methyltransferase